MLVPLHGSTQPFSYHMPPCHSRVQSADKLSMVFHYIEMSGYGDAAFAAIMLGPIWARAPISALDPDVHPVRPTDLSHAYAITSGLSVPPFASAAEWGHWGLSVKGAAPVDEDEE
ncbi:hypothetical protein B0H19DRAFT_1375725 [Mycena capillaripes]|nr:hypothetical protein B0H19DRAFT_1375725 [Mycena capillaripes]